MSEPVQKGEIDLKSLGQALNDGEAASEVSASTLQKNSDTLSQPPADVGKVAAASEGKVGSPATLSPSSPQALSPSATPAIQPAGDVPPAVAELKLMFPDLDHDTIGTVLASRGGDQEAAVNALLQMSDPEFKPSNADTNTDSDALLAETVAMEEQQRHHAEMARRQQQQQASMGRGGGGAGSFFSGLMGSDARDSAATSPSYDPNALTYQPRVRRGAPAAGARTSYMPPNHSPPAASPSYERGDSVIPGMPGAKEAKQWQEEINRMAETGLARAASTFSNFRQKASAAFNNPQEGQGQPGAVPSSGSGASSGSGFAQAFQNFRNNAAGRGSSTSSQASATAAATSPRQFTSPRSPHASEYDQDPSPVSDNELAKIISRGGGARGSSDASGGKARALAERYGLGIKNGGRSGAGASQTGGSAAGASDYAGWDQAGRTPISISDNTVKAVQEKRSDSIDRMDGAGGRGITSPRLDRSPTKETPTATKVGAAAVGGAAIGAGAGAALAAKHDDGDADGDSDDLEYVSNPFEDED